MGDLTVEKTALPGVLVITPQRFGDARGFFSESWNKAQLADHGIDRDFVQDNHSLSGAINTVRGLHYQSPPRAQDTTGALRARVSVRCGGGCAGWIAHL